MSCSFHIRILAGPRLVATLAPRGLVQIVPGISSGASARMRFRPSAVSDRDCGAPRSARMNAWNQWATPARGKRRTFLGMHEGDLRVQVAKARDSGYYWGVAGPRGREVANGYSGSRELAMAAAELWIAEACRHAASRMEGRLRESSDASQRVSVSARGSRSERGAAPRR